MPLNLNIHLWILCITCSMQCDLSRKHWVTSHLFSGSLRHGNLLWCLLIGKSLACSNGGKNQSSSTHSMVSYCRKKHFNGMKGCVWCICMTWHHAFNLWQIIGSVGPFCNFDLMIRIRYAYQLKPGLNSTLWFPH